MCSANKDEAATTPEANQSDVDMELTANHTEKHTVTQSAIGDAR